MLHLFVIYNPLSCAYERESLEACAGAGAEEQERRRKRRALECSYDFPLE